MRGGYETDERRLVQDFVHPGDRVLEVGASSGIISSFLWRQVGLGGRVISVEGNGQLKGFFGQVLKANGFNGEWIEAVAYPVWSADVPAAFRAKHFTLSENTLSSSVAAQSVESERTSAIGPEVLSLRQIAERTGCSPNVLVADVEGAEAVWCDTSPLLPGTIRTVIVEIHPRLIGMSAAGSAVQALVDEGFQVSGISGACFAMTRGLDES